MARKKKIIETPQAVETPQAIETPQAVETPQAIETPQAVEILKEIATPDAVKSKLAEIGATVNLNTENNFQKGTGIEDAIKSAQNSTAPPQANTPPPQVAPVVRTGRGRHAKNCACQKCAEKYALPPTTNANGEIVPPPVTPTPAKFDTIALMINSTLVPLASKRYNKDVKGVMLKNDQIDHLLTIKPESNMDRPSWVNYTLTAVSMLVMNFMTADSNDDKDTKTLNNSIKLFNKMSEDDKEVYLKALKNE